MQPYLLLRVSFQAAVEVRVNACSKPCVVRHSLMPTLVVVRQSVGHERGGVDGSEDNMAYLCGLNEVAIFMERGL